MRTRPASSPLPEAFLAFGDGSWIVPPAQVEGAERTVVGTGVVVMEHAMITVGAAGALRIGDGVRLARFASITAARHVSLGDKVSSSDGISITDTWGPVGHDAGGLTPPEPAPVVIGAGAYLGAGCVIGPGVTIGEGAFVGEGAVVVGDVAPRTIVQGNPAVLARAEVLPVGDRMEPGA